MRADLYRLAQALHQDCGGRLVPRENLHQTLVFLGAVAADHIPRLAALVADPDVAAFRLEFGTTGYWRHNRIVWAAPHAPPETLYALVAILQDGLRAAGFRFDQRSYTSHITLIRDARAPVMLPPVSFDWPIRDFALIESARSGRGAEYRVVARWPLPVART